MHHGVSLCRKERIECLLEYCECGEECTNRAIQQYELPYEVSVGPSPKGGLGVFANRDVEEGELVGEYVGEVLTNEEYDRRRREEYRDDSLCFAVLVDDNEVVDATRKGNEFRFLNHSCDPNVVLLRWKGT